jgi:transcriptional regulator with XRE-family HTH domain
VHPVIRYYREKKGLSQSRLAVLTHCSQAHISLVEQGFKRPNDQLLNAIAAALDVSPPFILLQQVEDDDVEQTTAEKTA